MAVAIRAAWTGTQSGSDRDVYANITTIAGDYLIVFSFRDAASGSPTTYTYDGTTMTSVANYNDSFGDTPIGCTMFRYDPGTNVGSKQIHIYINNGMAHRVYVLALTGVDPSDPVVDNDTAYTFYNASTMSVTMDAVINGLLVWGVIGSIENTLTELGAGVTEYTEFNDDASIHHICQLTATGASHAIGSSVGNTSDNDTRGIGISLRPLSPIDLSGSPISTQSSILVGTVDDGNVSISGLAVAQGALSISATTVVTQPIEADVLIRVN